MNKNTSRRPLLLGALLATICLTTMGQGIVNNIVTTAYTRIFLRSTTAAQALATLGITNSQSFTGSAGYLLQYDGASITNSIGFQNTTGVMFGSITNVGYFHIQNVSALPSFYVEDVISDTTPTQIDAAGRLIIGHTASISSGGVNQSLQVLATAGTAGLSASRWSADANAPVINLSKSRSATIGAFAAVVANDVLGQLRFNGDDGADIDNIAGRIIVYVEGTVAGNQVPGRMLFELTNPTGTITERLRLDSMGNMGLGVTAWGTSASNVFAMKHGVAPSTSITDGFQVYSGDVSGTAGNGGMLVRSETGTITGFGTSLLIGGGVNANGGGFKHARLTTGSINATSSAIVTNSWTTAFADANYTLTTSVQDATTALLSLRVVHIEALTATGVAVRVENSSAGALTGTLHLIAIHD